MRLPHFVHAAQVFAAAAQERAAEPALRWSPEEYTTYGQLDRFSNQLGRLLLAQGVQKRDTVCICLEKSLLSYGAILACLKIGAIYFVVDPAHPRERTRAMTALCRPAIALVETAAASADFDIPALPAQGSAGLLTCIPEMDAGPIDLPWDICGSDPAYVMFTSGSTGVPKGVTISQSNLVQFIQWSQHFFQTGPNDVFTNVNPLFFDNSVFDIYSSLFCGAVLAPFTAAAMRNPRKVISRVSDLGCTVFFSVPSLLIYFQTLKLIDRETFPTLRTIIFGGEGYPKPMLAKLYEAVGHRIDLVNVYGPTECTCICSAYHIGATDFGDLKGYPPLGKLNPGFSQVIADDVGKPVRAGEVGELYLGGPGVGLGYFGAPDLTERAFVQNPAEDRFCDRVYRTGDLVRQDASDGKLYFVGRTDFQIKRQGYRIELGEIEHALAALKGVDEAAVVHLTADNMNQIVAVIASSQVLDKRDIRANLSRTLPSYMMPERFIVVRQLMKNANGKTDRPGIAAAIARGEL